MNGTVQDGESGVTHCDLHDRGLAFDLSVLSGRRRVLAGIGAVTVLSAGSFFASPDDSEANTTATGADGTVCVKDPGETSGPYPGDGTNSANGGTVNVLADSGIVREDIRKSFGPLSLVATGVPLTLTLTVLDVGAACAPLAGHAVYVWHCDADGRYSIYDAPDRNYLRGVGITDAAGQVRFTTIFPACYAGRWPHIHFEVFADQASASTGKAAILTSQMLLPEDICTRVYAASAEYASSVTNLSEVTVLADNVFGNNTAEQLEAQTPEFGGDPVAGLSAAVRIGVAKA